jgi:glycolate oxidase FAD binding subunit
MRVVDLSMSNSSTISLREMLNDLIGVPYIREGTPLDAIDRHTPSLVVEPGSEHELSAVLAWCNERDLAVSPRGGGTKLGWGNSPRAVDVILSLERLDALIEHAYGDMTATVQAGMTLDEFQTELAKHGQMLALDVEQSQHATIGGVIATNDSGALRIRYGGIRDQIIGITIVRADGVVAHGGGRVVKNVAGYDLPKLFTGSLGSLGVITQATFRLYPLPAETRQLSVQIDSPAEAGELLLRVLDSTLMPTGLFVERSAGGAMTLTVRFSGIRESVGSQIQDAERILLSAGAAEPPLPLGEGWGEGTSNAAGAQHSPQPSPRGRGLG